MREPRWRRRATLLALALAVLACFLLLHGFWRRQLSHLTGRAEWIWVTDELAHLHPRAGLFVADLRLADPPARALLKVCGDREYVVYVNGTAAACGWSRPGFRLELYDVAHLLRQGDNVLAVEIRSPTPAGGLLFALDVGAAGRNLLTSGPTFVFRPAFTLAPPGPGDSQVPVSWGRPPRFPWGYPPPLPRPRTLDEVVVEDPVRLEVVKAMPGGGWECVIPQPRFGYLWLELEDDDAAFLTVDGGDAGLDPALARALAQPVVRTIGQHRWLDPEPRRIARVYVFGPRQPRAVELWPVPEEFRPAAPGVVPGRHAPEQRTRWTIRNHPG